MEPQKRGAAVGSSSDYVREPFLECDDFGIDCVRQCRMTFFVQMLSVSDTWQCIICGIQESSMILECNLAVFSGKISGNNLRIFVKFRMELLI